MWIKATLALLMFVPGCGAEYHARSTQAGLADDRMTLGNVQKDIHKGMNATEVLEVLGSPNIVTSGDNGSETWVYDKIATDIVSSRSGGWFVFFGSRSGASSSSQRTLTVIVKFDEQRKVNDLAYHSSRF